MWYFAGGDSRFYFIEQLQSLSWLPVPWNLEAGFGVPMLARMWFDYPHDVTIKLLSFVGLSWWWIDKLTWIAVFALAVYSSYKLAEYILGNSKAVAVLASIIYSTNTYILLLFGGGQVGVALAYSLSPLILLKFIQSIDSKEQRTKIKEQIVNGLWLALLIAFDLRLAYLIVGAAALYFVLSITYQVSGIKTKNILNTLYLILYTFALPSLIVLLIHMFWILPTILASGGISDLGEQFTNPGMLKFLSVADFSHAFSLLHANWPENLFGKVYFMQPEFLVLPLVAFTSLLFIKQKAENREQITYFALLALVGAFLAKGVQEPFGGVFQWMYTHVPGFVMFRDPTKFYLFTAIGYSVLIPYTLHQLGQQISIKYQACLPARQVLGIKYKNIPNTLYLILNTIFVLFWFFTIRPVFLGEMRGNFQPLRITPEYVRLKDMLTGDKTPSRVLWIPEGDTFSYFSEIHPILTSGQLFENASVSAIIAEIKKPKFMKTLADSGVRYVIVPTDLEKRLFLKDYRFNPEERNLLIHSLRNTRLIEDDEYTDIAVFKNEPFTMNVEVPLVVAKQQRFANIGLVVSAIATVGAAGAILVLKRRE